MRVLLLNPPPAGKVTKEGRVIIPLNITFEVPRFPLTLAMIATAARRHGLESLILDLPPGRASFKRLRRTLASFRPDLTVVNIATPTVETDRTGAAAARDAGSGVILFGQHAQALPARSLREIPEALADIVEGCLCKDPGDRFANAGALLSAQALRARCLRVFREGDAAVYGEPEPVLDAVFARLAADSGRVSGSAADRSPRGGFARSPENGKPGEAWREAIRPGGALDPPPHGFMLRERTGETGFADSGRPERWCPADDLPLPARDLLPPGRYRLPDGNPYTLVLASRGCPYACPFCLATPLNGRVHRSRSAAAVADEVRRIVETDRIRNFLFQSDLFTADRDWVAEFCERLLVSAPGVRWICNGRIDTLDRELLRLMAKAGCFLMSIGIESGDPGLLKAMHKRPDPERIVQTVEDAVSAGILVNGSFVIGFPGETGETLARTGALIDRLPLGFLVLMCATPFPGTTLYDTLLAENRLLGPGNELFSFNRYNIRSDVDPAAVYRFINRRLRKFYLRPSYLAARLREAGRPRALYGYLSYGVRRGREMTGAFPK